MKKNWKKLGLCFFLLFLVGSITTHYIYEKSKNLVIKNNSIMIGSILEDHPELEKEIIESLKEEKEEYGKNILLKYGLTSIESLEYLKSIQEYKRTFFISFFCLYLFLCILLSLYFYGIEKKQSRDIEKIDKYLFSLLEEEIKVDLKDFQSGELETLQNDLMKVTSRLKNALEHSKGASKELSKNLADISHQLKTPITSLTILNDVLTNTEMDEEKRLCFLKKQEEVITHTKTLIISLLKVSQIESGTIELKKEKINMQNILKDTLDELDLLIVSKNLNIEEEIKPDIFIEGDYLWLKEALMNIMKNGIEYSNQNGVIKITTLETPIFVELKIKDYGKGIKKEDLPHIFERFYKGSPSKDSIGIGLNLSKSILDRMNATIRVTSKLGEYTTFTIHFYKSVV